MILGGKAWIGEHPIPTYDPLTAVIVPALRALGHEVDILTARGTSNIAVAKTKWIKANMQGEPALIQPPPGVSKGKMGYDLLIDDGLHNVVSQLTEGRQAVIYDRAWNRDYHEAPAARVKSLRELLTKEWMQ